MNDYRRNLVAASAGLVASVIFTLGLAAVLGRGDAQTVSGGGGTPSLTAGAGISVSGSTITNAGVTSIAVGSSNLTVSGATGAVSVDMGSSLTPSSVTIGSGTAITKMVVYTPSLTPSQIAAAIGAAEQTFTVNGLTTADKVIVDPPAGQTALCPMVSARVSGTNTLALSFANLAVALCTPVSGTYSVLAIRS